MGDSLSVITQLASHVPRFEGLLRAIVFLIGATLVIQSLRLAVRRAEFGPQAASWSKTVAGFFAGAALLAFPHTVSALVGTLFGANDLHSASSIFSYGGGMLQPLAGSQKAVEAIVLIIQLIGFIAIARGLLFLNSAASAGGPRTFGPGFTFVIAGALAVNFPAFFGIMTELFVPSG